MTFNRQEVRNQTLTLQQSGKYLSTASKPQAEQTCHLGVSLLFHQTGFEDTTVKYQYFLGGYPTISCRKPISRPFSPFLARNYNFQIDLHVIIQWQASRTWPPCVPLPSKIPPSSPNPALLPLMCPGKGLLTLLWPLSWQLIEITSHTFSSSKLSFPFWARTLLLRGEPWKFLAQIVHLFWFTDLYSTASMFAPMARWMVYI